MKTLKSLELKESNAIKFCLRLIKQNNQLNKKLRLMSLEMHRLTIDKAKLELEQENVNRLLYKSEQEELAVLNEIESVFLSE